MQTVAFTICAYNYLSKALVLAESFKRTNPEKDFIIYLVGRKRPMKHYGVNIMFVEDLDICDYCHYAFKYDVIEFSTFLKPAIFERLMCNYFKVYYIDPDIMFFSSLEAADEALENYNCVLTPHTFRPVDDGCKPSDLDFCRFGAFNLGFIGLKKSEVSLDFLNWWNNRLQRYCFYDPQSGMAVDQKWIDLALIYFQGFKVLHNLGYNVAFWNLHERQITNTNDKFIVNDCEELVFVHFSSYNRSDHSVIANKQNRFNPGSRPDFSMVSKKYFDALSRMDSGFDNIPYCYNMFTDGKYISNTLRRIYSNMESEFKSDNIFDTNSAIYKFAIKHSLISSVTEERKNFKDISRFPLLQKLVIKGLRLALFLLGPDRYYILMRYMAYMSSIQNQSDMFVLKK